MTESTPLTLVLGLGESGLASARWLAYRNRPLRLADSRPNPPGVNALRTECPGMDVVFGDFSEALLEGVGEVVVSPGLPGDLPILESARRGGIPIVGEIELFAEALQELGSKAPVVAITGTNGKTTVTTLVGEMCRAAGLDAAVAGNISPAALDELLRRTKAGALPDVWVLELSSFQLETTHSLSPSAATVLNVSDDHLDRYEGLDDYASAKRRIFAGGGTQVLNRDDPRSLAMAAPGRRVVTFGLNPPPAVQDFGVLPLDGDYWLVGESERLVRISELGVRGLHNAANALAALALCRAIGLPMAPLERTLREFHGLAHRVQAVIETGGVLFIDDSKGTNVGATLAALTGLGRRAVLIAGGDGKGQNFSPLAQAVREHARAVVLIGRDAGTIGAVLEGLPVPVIHSPSLELATREAFLLAHPGDAVLLSPACASFDMFRNYEHRAEVFRAAAKVIAADQVRGSQAEAHT